MPINDLQLERLYRSEVNDYVTWQDDRRILEERLQVSCNENYDRQIENWRSAIEEEDTVSTLNEVAASQELTPNFHVGDWVTKIWGRDHGKIGKVVGVAEECIKVKFNDEEILIVNKRSVKKL